MISYEARPGFISFFSDFKHVVFRWKGSVIKACIPQMSISALLSVLVQTGVFERGTGKTSSFHSIIGVLLSFLLVFKANLSYSQYWEGRSHVGDLSRAARCLAMGGLSFLRGDGEGKQLTYAKFTLFRYIKLYYFMVVLHVRSTGPTGMDELRSTREVEEFNMVSRKVETLATDEELVQLVTLMRTQDIPFTRSQPLLVIQWIMLMLQGEVKRGALAENRLRAMDPPLELLVAAFHGMDKIDKMQFPFPYAQLVKIVLFCYVFSLPFTFPNESVFVHWSEPGVCALFALGFYGVDAIAEMLQDPFGKSDNDLPIHEMALGLEADLTTALLVVRDSQLPSEEEGRFLFKEFCDMPRQDQRDSVMYPGFSNSDSDSLQGLAHHHDLLPDGTQNPEPSHHHSQFAHHSAKQVQSVKHFHVSKAFDAIKQPNEVEEILQLAM